MVHSLDAMCARCEEMDTHSTPRASVNLDAGVAMTLRDSAGKGVAVLGGKVWITQQGDPRDIFIDRNESFIFDRPGLALVQAMADSTLLLFEVEPDAQPRRPQDITVRSGAA